MGRRNSKNVIPLFLFQRVLGMLEVWLVILQVIAGLKTVMPKEV